MRWAEKLEEAGVGELLLTSIDQEETSRGFDIDLIKRVQKLTSCPIIASGGYGNKNHIKDLLKSVRPSAIAIASALHYKKKDVMTIKKELISNYME